MTRFEGVRVLVTGGSGGIGGRIAERFAAEGAAVVSLDARPRAGERRVDIVGDVGLDLRDPEGVARAMATAIEMLGGVDVLVNAAGVFANGPLLDVTPATWDLVQDVNARGTLFAMQAAAGDMIGRGGPGRIVNLASMVVMRSGAGEGAYAASKAAVVALTHAAAAEWGPHGITVNAIAPGYVLTEMGAATRSEEDVRTWTALSPLGRLGTPDDVADMALFLASAEGGYVTGQTMDVTGGMTMH